MNGSKTILVTSNGAHSPLDWALATADHIVHVAPGASPETQMAARKLEIAIAEVLVPHHDGIQKTERAALASKGDARLGTEIDPSAKLGVAVAAIVACAAGTPFEAQFAQSDVQAVIRQTVGNHFATAISLERSWHADKNPDGPNAKAFIAAQRPASPAPVVEA